MPVFDVMGLDVCRAETFFSYPPHTENSFPQTRRLPCTLKRKDVMSDPVREPAGVSGLDGQNLFVRKAVKILIDRLLGEML